PPRASIVPVRVMVPDAATRIAPPPPPPPALVVPSVASPPPPPEPPINGSNSALPYGAPGVPVADTTPPIVTKPAPAPVPPPPGPSPVPPIAEATPFAPLPPSKPPGPPMPALLPRNVPLTTLPPLVAETSTVPAMVMLPVARIVTGVFAALRVNRTVTPEGIVTFVKLKTPLGGTASVTFAGGANTPSAPVLPLLNVCADTGPGVITARTNAIAVVVNRRMVASLVMLLTER